MMNDMEQIVALLAPSPLAGEGWGEGAVVVQIKIDRRAALPLTLTLSRKGRENKAHSDERQEWEK